MDKASVFLEASGGIFEDGEMGSAVEEEESVNEGNVWGKGERALRACVTT